MGRGQINFLKKLLENHENCLLSVTPMMIVALPENYSCLLYRNIDTVTPAYRRSDILLKKAQKKTKITKESASNTLQKPF